MDGASSHSAAVLESLGELFFDLKEVLVASHFEKLFYFLFNSGVSVGMFLSLLGPSFLCELEEVKDHLSR